MDSVNLNIRTDKEVKASAEKLFAALGLNMSTAVNMFLRQAIRENGIPFEVTLNIPNQITADAIAEGRALRRTLLQKATQAWMRSERRSMYEI